MERVRRITRNSDFRRRLAKGAIHLGGPRGGNRLRAAPGADLRSGATIDLAESEARVGMVRTRFVSLRAVHALRAEAALRGR
jgi:hypothetical protein